MQKQLVIKILIIVVVGFLVLVPTIMVEQKVYERHRYQLQAEETVAQSWTGRQVLLTPVIIIPYQISLSRASGFITDSEMSPVKRTAFILPDHISSDISVDNKSVFKGIYEVPVYTSNIALAGEFSANKISAVVDELGQHKQLGQVGKPYIALHVSDIRGIDKAPELKINGQVVTLTPGSQILKLPSGLSASVPSLLDNKASVKFNLQLALRGMGSWSIIALADEATTQLSSNWPHPEFIGASLPSHREISAQGFVANWLSTRYSSNSASLLESCLLQAKCKPLLASASGVKFIQPVDVYLQSERSVKYALLFIGLSFVTFFIFEHIKNIRIHPIQYAFVGLAIAVFYLLLISLAEHMAFRWAYLIGVICCSSLLLFYVRYMLKSLRSSLLFILMIVSLFGLLYVIVQAEDFALLMGAMLVFFVLTALMTVTRNIDWYNLVEVDNDERLGESGELVPPQKL